MSGVTDPAYVKVMGMRACSCTMSTVTSCAGSRLRLRRRWYRLSSGWQVCVRRYDQNINTIVRRMDGKHNEEAQILSESNENAQK